MMKFKYRFFVAVMGITLLVMTSLGVIIGQLYESFYVNQLTNRLHKEAHLAAYILSANDMNTDSQTIANDISNRLDARITILAPDGNVLGESSTHPAQMDNHRDRPEIQDLLSGEIGEIIRYSKTVHQEMLYTAVPIEQNKHVIGYLRIGISTQTLAAMNKRIWGILIVSFLISFLVISAITFRIASQMTKPIENVTTVASELAQGNYNVRTDEGNHGEIGQLTKSINILAHHIDHLTQTHQTQQERMKTLIENMGSGLILINKGGEITLLNQTCRAIFGEQVDRWLGMVYYDVINEEDINNTIQNVFSTEQKQRSQLSFSTKPTSYYNVHAAPILQANGKLTGVTIVLHDITELKKLENVRKDFVANVSHELKTPVTSIKGFTETLLDDTMNTEALQTTFLEIIWKESERLQQLINNLLDLSRIEQQYFTLNWQVVDVTQILNDVIQLLERKSNEKAITIVTTVHGDPHFEGDSARLKQIFINLLSNSIAFTPANGQIGITITGLETKVQIEIQDTGIGISEIDMPRIFERFYRVDKARSRDSGGTGLGLAIVKHLVEAHHGHIQVESKLEEGTTFTLLFHRQPSG